MFPLKLEYSYPGGREHCCVCLSGKVDICKTSLSSGSASAWVLVGKVTKQMTNRWSFRRLQRVFSLSRFCWSLMRQGVLHKLDVDSIFVFTALNPFVVILMDDSIYLFLLLHGQEREGRHSARLAAATGRVRGDPSTRNHPLTQCSRKRCPAGVGVHPTTDGTLRCRVALLLLSAFYTSSARMPAWCMNSLCKDWNNSSNICSLYR